MPEDQHPGIWRHLAPWLSLNHPLAWLVGLTCALVLLLPWLPAYVRLFFWHGLRAHRLLASMTMGFSLVALSLLWARGPYALIPGLAHSSTYVPTADPG